jgi:hypothetical protein
LLFRCPQQGDPRKEITGLKAPAEWRNDTTVKPEQCGAANDSLMGFWFGEIRNEFRKKL